MIASVIITKGKPVTAHCQNLTSRPHRTTTRNKLHSITKLRAQPNVLAEHAIQLCTDNRSIRYGHLNAMSNRPRQLILSGSTVTLNYLPLSDPVTTDKLSRQERCPLLLDPHSTALTVPRDPKGLHSSRPDLQSFPGSSATPRAFSLMVYPRCKLNDSSSVRYEQGNHDQKV